MILDETDDRFEVRDSTVSGAGRGLFTVKPLVVGDKLKVIGVLVRPGSVADDCTSFADPYKFRVGDLLLIPFGLGGMANHSSTPNMEKLTQGHDVYLVATRDVAIDEEIFWSYSEFAQQPFGRS